MSSENILLQTLRYLLWWRNFRDL